MRVISRFAAWFGSGGVPVAEGDGAIDIGWVRLGKGQNRLAGGPVRYRVIRLSGAVLIGKARLRLDVIARAVKHQRPFALSLSREWVNPLRHAKGLVAAIAHIGHARQCGTGLRVIIGRRDLGQGLRRLPEVPPLAASRVPHRLRSWAGAT